MKKITLLFLLCSLNSFCQKHFDLFFDFNQDVPNEVSQNKLNQWVLDNKSIEVTKVLGFCDSVDTKNYNKDLAMRRVNSVAAFLNKSNIKINDKAELTAFGKDFKLSKNQNENRKVEIYYKDIQAKDSKSIAEEEETIRFTEAAELIADEKAGLAPKFAKAKKGDVIRINNMNFYFNSEKMMEQSMPILEELHLILLDNPKLRIEIHGHICCNPNTMDTKLSFRRALFIFKYLANHGIAQNRLAYKGIGSNDPIYPLPEKNEKEKAANRRVEILIVDK